MDLHLRQCYNTSTLISVKIKFLSKYIILLYNEEKVNNIDSFHVNMLLEGGSNISVNIFIFAKFVFYLAYF